MDWMGLNIIIMSYRGVHNWGLASDETPSADMHSAAFA
jgi:hypothetical protein